ncbi:cap-specific mRNA (nucleoside-2'-O-)-methyltransferase 2-like [Ruditapes philippinarum]|uniref:cap-specific mRNA (nucleoside-2'-O-)-methyltransferase 2-like n=1 Tax=Ruditapes philippinarum TaxID=129788 RepID=UPI00295A6193|nr:cap-specific mRNA (nucleoside-2'-O-)-methyltransferase 2-like [Ruditapes philippinarum]
MDFLEVTSRKRKRRISDNRTQLPSNIQNFIKSLFEKKISYEKKEDYELRASCDWKMREEWKIEEYMLMKNELNTLKNELNDKDMITWHEHTRLVNLAGNIAPGIRNQLRPELCTQAWCKFYEIASTYVNVANTESLVTVHLCEAPGAFVTSLNHFLFTHEYAGDWMWLATTLNPYYEGNNIGQMIDEDVFIRSSYGNWYFGEDNTGNLMSPVNLKGLQEKLANVKVDLVTADGSIDCQGDPAEQENVVSRLQHCEVLTALHILSPGGTLVVKMFTLFECKAISLMYLLNCVFEKVEVFKPCTSKGGNSEVYVIGQVFKGRQCCESFLQNVTPEYFGDNEPAGCLFSQDEIPSSFLDQHSHCVQFFKDCQMSTIQRNLDLLNVMTDDERSKVEEQKDFCMECFFNKYDIKPMQHGARLMKLPPKRRKQAPSWTTEFSAKVKLEGKFTGSFCERQELSTLPWQQKICKIETYEDEVNRPDNSLWIQCQHNMMSEKDLDTYQILKGKHVDSIQSSRFCHGFYLHRTDEIVKNSKWLAEQTVADTDFLIKVASKLREILSDTIQYYNDKPLQQLQSNPDDMVTVKPSQHGCDSGNEVAGKSVNRCDSVTDTDGKAAATDNEVLGTSTPVIVDDEVGAGVDTGQMGEVNDDSKEKIVCNDCINNDGDKVVSSAQNRVQKCSASNNTGEIGEVENVRSEEMKLDTCSNGYNGINDGRTIDSSSTCDTNSVETKTDNVMSIGGDAPRFTCTCVKGGSPVLEELSKQGCSSGITVRLYALGSRKVCDRFELVDDKDLLAVVLDIIKTCNTSDYVIIEMGTCLSRFTAGLVYILYRTFREIGFVHHHGNLLKRHLLCINFQHCPMKLCQYLEEVCHMIDSDQSESVLEIVPVLTILEDDDFTSFLRISNVNLLQSFITTVVKAEKKEHSL